MLENSFVFEVAAVLFRSGAVSWDKTRSGMFDNIFYSGSDWVLSICGRDFEVFWISFVRIGCYEVRIISPCIVALLKTTF